MNMQGAFNKEILRCDTPSTDETNASIIESFSQLSQLLQLIFTENYTYTELKQYFRCSFDQIDRPKCFIEQIERSIKIYMEKILQHIKLSLTCQALDFKYIKDHSITIKNIYKSYKDTQMKSQQLQLVVKSYQMKENITESIHCVRLMKHSYINTILKETEINNFLITMQSMFDKKFYQQAQKYKNTSEKLKMLIQLTNTIQRPTITLNDNYRKIENENNEFQTNIQICEQMEQKVVIIPKQLNEYKQFEIKLEEIYEQNKNKEKKDINVSKKWLNNIKQRLNRK